jgi:hypothetical protein
MAGTEIQRIILKYEADIKQLRSDLDKVQGEMSDVDKANEKSTKSISTNWKKAGAAIAGAIAAAKLGEFIKGLADLQKEANGVQKRFAQFENSEAILRRLQDATKGTVSELQLMQVAIKANNFKIPLDTLEKGLAFARQRANETGESVEFLTDSIINGLGRKSPLILDNLGISAAELSAEAKKTGDFMSAAATIIERELVPAGEQIDTLADKQDRLNARIQDLRLELSNKLAPAFEGVLQGANFFVDKLNEIRTFGGIFTKKEQDDAISGAQDFVARVNKVIELRELDQKESTELIKAAIEEQTQEFEEAEERNEKLSKGQIARIRLRARENKAALEDLLLSITGVQGGYVDVEPEIKKTTAAIEAQAKAIEAQAEAVKDLTGEDEDLVKYFSDLLGVIDGAKKKVEGFNEELGVYVNAAGEIAGDEDPAALFFPTEEEVADDSDIDEAQAALQVADAVVSAEQMKQDAFLQTASVGIQSLKQLFGESSAAATALFALEKVLAIAEVIVSLQREIALINANPTLTLLPDAGLSAKTALITAAKIRAGFSIATIGAQSIAAVGQGFAEGKSDDNYEGFAWVGEKGKEIMYVPQRARIFTARASKKHKDGLIEAINREREDDYIRKHYLQPQIDYIVSQLEVGSGFDDSRVVRELRKNRTIELGPKTRRLFNQPQKRWR